MVKKPTGDIEDIVLKDHVDSVNANFLQNAIELDAAPTAAVPLLDDDEVGIYSNAIYWRKSSTIYVFSSDSQITIT